MELNTDDNVSFNGTAATVLSASITQLIVAVPAGAPTGPVSVTVGSQTVTTATAFVVDDTGEPPTITQVSPAVVTLGQAVTIAGTHLDPAAGNTVVKTGGMDMLSLSSISDTQLQYVPPTSGYISVETPYGQATSTAPILVLPSGVNSSNVVSTGTAAIGGAPVNLNIAAAGQVGVLAFDGVAGQWLSLQASSVPEAAGGLNYAVYAPGNVLVQQGVLSSSSPSIHLPKLETSGTYVVTFQVATVGVQLVINIEADAMLADNATLAISTNAPGQSKRLILAAVAGQNLEFTLTGVSITGSTSSPMSVNIYNPDAINIVSAQSCPNTGICRYPVWNAQGGTYTVVVAPPDAVSEIGFNAMLIPDIQGPALSANTPVAINLGVGQVERYTVTANRGSNLALNLSNVNTGNFTWPVNVNVYGPGAGAITTTNYYATFNAPGSNGSNALNLTNLPASGVYTLIVYTSGVPATAQLAFASNVTGNIAENGASQSDADSIPGQNVFMTFNANQGDNLVLTLSDMSITGATSSPASVNVYSANGTNIAGSSNCYQGGGCQYTLWNLAAGAYTMIVSPPTAGSTISFNATLGPLGSATSPLMTTGVNQSEVASAPGQNVYLSFTANQGDNLELTLSAVSGSGGSLTINVFDSNGTNVASGSDCYNGWTCRYSLWSLAAGNYTVVVSPTGAGGSLGFNAMLEPDIVGPVLSANTPATVNLSLGQVERLTFNANAGASVNLDLSGVSTTNPSGLSAYVSVYRPDVGTITTSDAYNSFSSTSSGTLSLQNLPVSGVYTIVVSTSGVVGSSTLELVPQ